MKNVDIHLPSYTVEDVGTIDQLSDNIDWGHRDLKIPNAWMDSKGEDVVVMIIDSGYANHPDIGDNELNIASTSFVLGEDRSDKNGHSTHIAGIVAAQNNAMGVVGVAPKAKVITVKALDKHGRTNDTVLKKALEYAISIRPDIVNLSLGSFQRQESLEPLYQKLYELNIPVVCAAGNSGDKGVMYPARYTTTIAVGSYSPNRELSKFSAFSAEKYVDFVAPGDQILSTYLDGQYAVMSGTSMAAPFVSGILALVISLYKKNNQTYTVDELRNVLTSSSIDMGEAGEDNKFGNGIINLEKAIEQIKTFKKEDREKFKEIVPLTWRQKILNKIKWK